MQDQTRRFRVWRTGDGGVTLWAVLSTAYAKQLPVIWSKDWDEGTIFSHAEAKSILRRYPENSGTAPAYEEGHEAA
jgi:hypothetical protein